MQNLFSQLTTTDYVQIIGIILSFLIGIIAIVISIATLKQNNKMIEESTRPFICIYTKMILIFKDAIK